MVSEIEGCLDDQTNQILDNAKVLVVGAGGIGCELLKNLVLIGFKDIAVIDLDTIDVSNLNRQFLFHKQHVGKSKAVVAKESALSFNPDAKITAIHGSITNPDYGINYFQQFDLVLNALDNRAARNHVNRLCLGASVPLLESGTAGYDGQVELIAKGQTKCYECDPKAPQKTFPGCTIRNTPSEPIHCIVWAKHLFNQLFGEEDPDQDVSPDSEDPEAKNKSEGDQAKNVDQDWSSKSAEAGEDATNVNQIVKPDSPDPKAAGDANSESVLTAKDKKVKTRNLAEGCNYDPKTLFTKLFCDDIKYLLSMDKLWNERRPPSPLDWDNLSTAVEGSSQEHEGQLKDQRRWSVAECASVFSNCCREYGKRYKKLKKGDHLNITWDKDESCDMNFVTACANIRAEIFGIPGKSRFDVKSMAGNIIPAIATTNAIVAGIVVLHALSILQKKFENCQSVYLRLRPNPRGLIIVPERQLQPPNPKCSVCSSKPTVKLALNTEKMTVKEFEQLVLKKELNMVAPDAMLNDGSGSIIISSDEDETMDNNDKTLAEVGVRDHAFITVDDFVQKYELSLVVIHKVDIPEGLPFQILTRGEDVKPKEDPETSNKEDGQGEESDDEPMIVVEKDMQNTKISPKRKAEPEDVPSKKRKLNNDELDA